MKNKALILIIAVVVIVACMFFFFHKENEVEEVQETKTAVPETVKQDETSEPERFS